MIDAPLHIGCHLLRTRKFVAHLLLEIAGIERGRSWEGLLQRLM